jgi:hydrogenase-4 component E
MAFLVLSNLMIAGTGRLHACVRYVAFQGILIGFLPLLLANHSITNLRIVFLAALSIVLRGVVYPWVLRRTLRSMNVRQEIDPFVGYGISLIIVICLISISFWLSSRFTSGFASNLSIAVALSTILTGLFIIIGRKLALNQILGYITLENGIYILGLTLVQEIPMLVELSVLMDAFVAVLVMSVATYQINKEFDHIDIRQLDSLKG